MACPFVQVIHLTLCMGYPCVTCKRGGDVTLRHSAICDVLFNTFCRAGLSSHLEVGSDWGQDCSRTRSRHLCHQLRQRHLSAFDVTVTSLLNSSVIMEVGMYPGDAARAAEFRKHSDNEQNVLN